MNWPDFDLMCKWVCVGTWLQKHLSENAISLTLTPTVGPPSFARIVFIRAQVNSCPRRKEWGGGKRRETYLLARETRGRLREKCASHSAMASVNITLLTLMKFLKNSPGWPIEPCSLHSIVYDRKSFSSVGRNWKSSFGRTLNECRLQGSMG